MRILIIIPVEIQPQVRATALQHLNLGGMGVALNRPYTADGENHTHYVACTLVSPENQPVIEQLVPNFDGLEVIETDDPQTELKTRNLNPIETNE